MYGIYANIWGILMVNVTIYGIHGSYGYRNGFAPKWVRGSSNWPGRSSRLQPASAQTSRYSSPGIHGTCWAKVTGDPSQLRRADGARQIPFQLGCCGRRSNILSMAALVAWKTPVKKHRGWNLLEPVGTCWNYGADVMGLLSFLQSNLESLEISRSGIQGVCTFLADEKTEQICRNLLTDSPLKIDFPQSFAMATWMCISVSKCECYVTL